MARSNKTISVAPITEFKYKKWKVIRWEDSEWVIVTSNIFNTGQAAAAFAKRYAEINGLEIDVFANAQLRSK